MNIAQMVVGLGVDPGGASKGLAEGEKEFKRFTGRVKSLFGSTELISAKALASQGENAARSLVTALQQTYQQEAAKSRDLLVRGLIDEERFRTAGAEAAGAFNRGLTGGLQDLSSAGLLTSGIQGRLSDQFKATGTSSATAFWSAATAGLLAQRSLPPFLPTGQIVAQADAGATTMVRAFSAGVLAGRPDIARALGTGLIDDRRLLASGSQAGRALISGVRGGAVTAAGGGLIPPTVGTGIASQMGEFGRRAGARFTDEAADEIRRRRREIEQQISTVGLGLQQVGRGLTAAITLPLVAGSVAAIKFEADFERAFAEVAKTTGLAGRDLETFQARLKGLSETPGFGSLTDLAGIAALGGQLGVVNDQLDAFTTTVKQFDEAAPSLNAEEAATALARLQVILGGTADEFSRTASAISLMGDKTASTEAEIVDLGLRIAGVAASFNQSKADVVGFAAAIASLGINAEAGGTSFQNVVLDIAKASSAGGRQLNNFAAVAGTTASEFKRLFETDATEAVLRFVEGLGRLKRSGGDVQRVLAGLKFDDVRTIRLLLSAAAASDTFRAAVEQSNQAFQENTRLGQEFARSSGVIGADLNAIAQQARNVTQEFGAGLAPVLRDILTLFRSLLGPVRTAARFFGELPKPVRALAVAVGLVAAAVGPALLLLGRLAQSIVFLKAASLIATGAGGLGVLASILTVGGPLLIGLAAAAGLVALLGSSSRDAAADLDRFSQSLVGASKSELIATGAAIQKQIDSLNEQKQQLERARMGFASDATAVLGTRSSFNPGEIERKLGLVDEQLAQLNARANATADAFNATAKAEERMVASAKEAGAALGDALNLEGFQFSDKPFEKLTTGAQNALSSLQALQEAGRGLAAGVLGGDPLVIRLDTTRALDQIRALRGEVGRQIAAAGGDARAPKALTDLSRQLGESLRNFNANATAFADNLGRAMARGAGLLGAAQDRFAKLFAAQLEVEFKATLDPGSLAEDTADLAARVKKQLVTDPALKLDLGIEKAFNNATTERALAQLEHDLEEALDPAGKLLGVLGSFGGALGNLRGVSDAIADIGLGLEDALAGALDVREILGQLDAGKNADGTQASGLDQLGQVASLVGAAGQIVSAISGVAQVIGGLFAESALEKSIRENRVATEKLTREIGNVGADVAGGEFARLQQAIANALARPAIDSGVKGAGFGRVFEQELARLGLTLDQARAIAETFGLNLDRLSRTNLAEFARGLAQVELTRFATTFTGQLEQLTRGFDILGVEDPAEKLRQFIGTLTDADVGSPAILRALRGIDLSTAQGIEQAREAIRQLFRDFEDLTPADLGGLSPEEFLDALATAAGFASDALGDMGRDLGDLNIPSGFKRAAAEFAAQLPEVLDKALSGTDIRPQIETGALAQELEVTIPADLKAAFDALKQGLLAQTASTDREFPAFAAALARFSTAIPRDLPDALKRMGTVTPPDLLGKLGQIASTTPADLLGAVDKVRQAVMQPITLTPIVTSPPELTDALARLAQVTPPDLLSRLDSIRQTIEQQGARLPVVPAPVPGGAASTQPTVVFRIEPGAIVIEAGQRNGGDIAEEVLAKLREKARAQTGDTLNVAGLI